jgi:integrase
LFKWAAYKKLVPGSPFVGVVLPGDETKRERVLSETELVALWRACDALGLIFGCYLKVLLLTAQRRGEVATVQWDHLDLDGALWTIPAAQYKSHHAHEVPLAASVVVLLRALPRRGPFVFTTNGRVPLSGFSKLTAALVKASEVTGWRLHDFRRSAATTMADQLGIPLHTIRRVLGHAEPGVTEAYVRFSWAREKRAALVRWSEYLEKIVTNVEHGEPC